MGETELDPTGPEAGATELDATTGDGTGGGMSSPPGAGTTEPVFMSEEEEKLADANDRYLRLMADFDNFRKRTQKERQDIQAYATEDVVREILPVMDNLERALLAGREKGNEDSGVMKGVDLTLRMFQVVLEKFGVTRIKAAGEPFDPHRHEAIMQSESPEVVVETVSEELEPGYVMRGRVVRPARVRVLKPKPAAEAA